MGRACPARSRGRARTAGIDERGGRAMSNVIAMTRWKEMQCPDCGHKGLIKGAVYMAHKDASRLKLRCKKCGAANPIYACIPRMSRKARLRLGPARVLRMPVGDPPTAA